MNQPSQTGQFEFAPQVPDIVKAETVQGGTDRSELVSEVP